jgi:polyisoprenoid-binding protein YceI
MASPDGPNDKWTKALVVTLIFSLSGFGITALSGAFYMGRLDASVAINKDAIAAVKVEAAKDTASVRTDLIVYQGSVTTEKAELNRIIREMADSVAHMRGILDGITGTKK